MPGTLVAGRYRIISLLGRGGMGEVYRATDLTLSQPVALKFLPDSGPDSTTCWRFWVLYIALEPVVRARWPHSILTLSRLLAGRWQDAQVGAHVRYGALVGLIFTAFFLVSQWVETSRGFIGAAAAEDVGVGARYFMAHVLGNLLFSHGFPQTLDRLHSGRGAPHPVGKRHLEGGHMLYTGLGNRGITQ